MNSCPHCGREPHSSNQRCPACPADIAVQDQQKNNEQNHHVIEPEVVRNANGHYEQSGSQWSQGGTTFKTFRFGSFGSGSGAGYGLGRQDSCLPGMITLGIALSLGIQFGLLASIGFLVFYAIGSAISFFASMRQILQGRVVSPWAWRAIVWIVSAFITIGLAS